jgi:uncharacterized protein (DUF169 family)
VLPRLCEALALRHHPVGILLTDERPAVALQFEPGRWGCVASMLVAASEGRTVAFDRGTYGCPGGGVGLGFGDAYADFPIACLLSTGGKVTGGDGRAHDLGGGERFLATPEVASRWVASLPLREVETTYVVAKPLTDFTARETPDLIWILVTPDQLSALVFLAGFRRGAATTVTAPWGAACQTILFALAEAEREEPRGVVGFFDISQRHRVARDLLSFTAPRALALEMEASVEESFLRCPPWLKLRARQ